MNKKIVFIFITVLFFTIFVEAFSYIYRVSATNTESIDEYYNSVLSQYIHHTMDYRIDPFFGFVYSSDSQYFDSEAKQMVKRDVNNYGFISSFDYPYIKKENEIVIALAGGSVANNLGNFFNHNQSFKELEKKIGKKIVFINLAIGMAKQPQQFFITSYFIDSIDFMINYDGFNEICNEQIPLENPAFSLIRVTQDEKALNQYISYVAYKKEVFKKAEFNKNSILKYSNFAFLLHYFSYQGFKKQQTDLEKVIKDTKVLNSVAKIWKIDQFKQLPEDIKLKKRVDMWLKYAEMGKDLFNLRGKTFINILQPNLWVKNSKQFSAQEIEMKKNNYKLTEEIINQSYEYAHSKIKDKNYFYDLTNIFQNENDTLYVDHCCHMNHKGVEIVAKKVIEIIENKL